MAVSQLAEVIALPYTAWVAPAGTAFPSVTMEESSFATGATGWTKLGTSGNLNYSEAGVTVTHTQTQGQFVSAGGITPRKKWRTDEGMQVAFDLVDLSPKQYALIMDEQKVTATTGEEWFELKRGITVHVYALLLRGTSTLNEEKKGQYEINTCCQMSNPAPKFALKGGPAMLALQFDVLEFEANKWATFRQLK